jgi:hypothetical protein
MMHVLFSWKDYPRIHTLYRRLPYSQLDRRRYPDCIIVFLFWRYLI